MENSMMEMIREFRESAGTDFSEKATFLTVHKPVKGWSVQQIEFSEKYGDFIPCEFYPNGDILEWGLPTEKHAIDEALRCAAELDLPFNYTTKSGQHILC